jgi:hypothetical protein
MLFTAIRLTLLSLFFFTYFIRNTQKLIRPSPVTNTTTYSPVTNTTTYQTCKSKGTTQEFRPYFQFGDQGRYSHHEYLNNETDSVVIEVGGFTGVDSQKLLDIYPTIALHIYEPHPSYFGQLVDRFIKDSRVTVYPFGVDGGYKIAFLKDSTDGSSVYDTKAVHQKALGIKIVLRDAVQEFKSLVALYDKPISLLQVNCEGCEYGLLDAIVDDEFAVGLIDNIQVQFHTMKDDGEGLHRYCRIQSLLSRTHQQSFGFHYVWENWRRRKVSN